MNDVPSRLHGPLRRILGEHRHRFLIRLWHEVRYQRSRWPSALRRWWRHGRPAPLIAFHPQRPTRYHVIRRVCGRLGYAITGRATARAALVVAFSTETRWEPDLALRRLAQQRQVVNIGCTDISKHRVNEVFGRVFDYELAVDPLIHRGPAVRKSDRNAVHDGEIVSCPVERVPDDVVFQRVIDNRTGDGRVLDLRVAVIGGRVPLVYRRYRPEDRRFRSGNERAELTAPGEELSAEEIASLERFASAMGLDLGEMDVLRDAGDGRIYVVDVNTTPWGPPSGLVPEDVEPALDRLARAFHAVVEGPRGEATIT